MSTRPLLNLDGYTDLPPGKIAAVVTFLEMRERPRLRRPAAPGLRVVPLRGDLPRYRALFRRIGEDWLWFSRAVMPDESLDAILSAPAVEAFALTDGAADLGLIEIEFQPRRDCELKYFGLVPEAIGTGAGRFLMNEAIRRAFRRPIRRLFLHTCSLDHPAALPFYLRSGFVAYRRAVEVADDPRLTGALPAEAAPQVPVIGAPKRARRRPARP